MTRHWSGHLAATLIALALPFAVAFSAGAAQAASLGISLSHDPDITVTGLAVSYDATAGHLTVGGDASEITASAFSLVGADIFDSPSKTGLGLFSLDANITSAGVFSSGSFTVSGFIRDTDLAGPVLLTGTLTALGFADPQTIEFLFTSSVISVEATGGGNLNATYGANGAMILSQTGLPAPPVPGSIETADGSPFQTSCDPCTISGIGDVSTTAVPLPATGLLVLGGMALVTAVRTSRDRRKSPHR